MHFKQHFIDTVDLEKVFYEVIRNKTPAEMTFEDFIDGLRCLSRKMVRMVVSESESQNALLGNEDLLFNRFLQQIIKPFFEEHKVKEIGLTYQLAEVTSIFNKNNSFFKKFFEAITEYPIEDPSSQ